MQLEELSNISDNLAMMPDPALQQFAQMHKQDPYMVSLALSESNRRKKMRTAARGQAGSMPQPKVVDAAIQGMQPAPMVAQTRLPENQGIAQLPTPNIKTLADGGIAGYEDDQEGMATGGMGGMFNFAQQSEPVVRMAGGGMAGYIPGYKNTGAVNSAFEDAFRTTLRFEGGYVADDAGKGPSNFGINKSANPDVDIKNLTEEKAREIYKKRFWDVIGGDALAAKDPAFAKVAFDTAVNIGVNKTKRLITDAKGDSAALLGMRQQHYDNLVKANPEKFAPYEKGWRNRVASLATSIIPSAEAGTLPSKPAAAPVDTSLAAQIPGQSRQAPASTYDQQNSYFGRLADTMGIPQEYQRNIGNTMNALSGFTSPINTANRAVGQASKALEATPEMIAKAEQAKRVAETQRLLPPAKVGLEALDEASQATRAAAEAARRARGVEQDVQAAKAAEQSVDAANLTSKIARTTEEAIAAGPNARAIDASKLATASKTLAGNQLAEEKVKGLFADNKRPEVDNTENQSAAETARLLRQNELVETAPKPSDVLAATKEAVPAKERKGFGNDDLLMLGLSLLASKSPNFMTALGEAGIQTLGAKREREKAETDLEYKDIMKKYYGSLGSKAEADAKNLEAGTKYNAQARQQATENIAREMQKWYSTLGGMNPTPQEEEAKRNSLARQYFPLAGLEVPATIGSPAPSAGFKVLGSRPQ